MANGEKNDLFTNLFLFIDPEALEFAGPRASELKEHQYRTLLVIRSHLTSH